MTASTTLLNNKSASNNVNIDNIQYNKMNYNNQYILNNSNHFFTQNNEINNSNNNYNNYSFNHSYKINNNNYNNYSSNHSYKINNNNYNNSLINNNKLLDSSLSSTINKTNTLLSIQQNSILPRSKFLENINNNNKKNNINNNCFNIIKSNNINQNGINNNIINNNVNNDYSNNQFKQEIPVMPNRINNQNDDIKKPIKNENSNKILNSDNKTLNNLNKNQKEKKMISKNKLLDNVKSSDLLLTKVINPKISKRKKKINGKELSKNSHKVSNKCNTSCVSYKSKTEKERKGKNEKMNTHKKANELNIKKDEQLIAESLYKTKAPHKNMIYLVNKILKHLYISSELIIYDILKNTNIFNDKTKDFSLKSKINVYGAALARKLSKKIEDKNILIKILIRIIKNKNELINKGIKFKSNYPTFDFLFDFSLYQRQKRMALIKDLFVFPFKGINSVIVTSEDEKRLISGKMFNDNLIEFCIKWLENTILTESQKSNVHFFNSFFFDQLYSRKTLSPEEMYDSVKKWTSKVDIFDKNYIFIPINESMHWYLMMIYNPSAFLVNNDLIKLGIKEEDSKINETSKSATNESIDLIDNNDIDSLNIHETTDSIDTTDAFDSMDTSTLTNSIETTGDEGGRDNSINEILIDTESETNSIIENNKKVIMNNENFQTNNENNLFESMKTNETDNNVHNIDNKLNNTINNNPEIMNVKNSNNINNSLETISNLENNNRNLNNSNNNNNNNNFKSNKIIIDKEEEIFEIKSKESEIDVSLNDENEKKKNEEITIIESDEYNNDDDDDKNNNNNNNKPLNKKSIKNNNRNNYNMNDNNIDSNVQIQIEIDDDFQINQKSKNRSNNRNNNSNKSKNNQNKNKSSNNSNNSKNKNNDDDNKPIIINNKNKTSTTRNSKNRNNDDDNKPIIINNKNKTSTTRNSRNRNNDDDNKPIIINNKNKTSTTRNSKKKNKSSKKNCSEIIDIVEINSVIKKENPFIKILISDANELIKYLNKSKFEYCEYNIEKLRQLIIRETAIKMISYLKALKRKDLRKNNQFESNKAKHSSSHTKKSNANSTSHNNIKSNSNKSNSQVVNDNLEKTKKNKNNQSNYNYNNRYFTRTNLNPDVIEESNNILENLNMIKDKVRKPLSKDNCYIVIFDSINGKHPTAAKIINSYLSSEAFHKKNKIINKKVRCLYAKVPKQSNSLDCGVYLIKYIETFLQDPDKYMNMVLLSKKDDEQWFKKSSIKRKREDIRDLIIKLTEEYKKEQEEKEKQSNVKIEN
ncbi:cysteine proteinase [Anaeromyces robustus]|uniref:Cysteine proteinase n=1 Tax=Anaeromyces robustus TaxID=1754192 RepID=A0A1Y1XN01_9FUNG|nr:cysteine proteinase [Anaeromyces robustus]|eukprot:ORX86886.1 cysteine proteinase [Anaeromyces robustus]